MGRDEAQKKFLESVRSESEVIKKCSTNAGSIERTIVRLLPMLQNHVLSSEIVEGWESDYASDMKELDGLAKRGCQELTLAFRELWEELVSKPKITRREKKMGMIYCTINGIKAAKFLAKIMQVVCEGTVCHFVEPPLKTAYECLENMHCERIARSWDVCFAPNAHQYLLKTSPREAAAKAESTTYMPWVQLLRLEKAWKLRTERLRVRGGRIRGEKSCRLYGAHLADGEARFNYFACDLKKCEAADGQPQIFRRQNLHDILDRLLFELEIALEEKYRKPSFHTDVGEDTHASTKKYQDDLKLLVPLSEELIRHYKNMNFKFTLKKLVSKVEQEIKTRGITLNSQTQTRIKQAIRQARANLKGKLRQIKSRKKGKSPKKPLQPSSKTDSQNQKRVLKQKNKRQRSLKSAS